MTKFPIWVTMEMICKDNIFFANDNTFFQIVNLILRNKMQYLHKKCYLCSGETSISYPINEYLSHNCIN